MATTRKRTNTNTRRKTTRRPVTRKKKTADRKPVRRNTEKKPVRNVKKTRDMTWGKSVKGHPISGRPVAGRRMSQRDQKLFTKMGKRRAGVTLKKIKEAYGKDYDRLVRAKKSEPKKTRSTAKRKPAARKSTTPTRRKGSVVTVSGLPARPQKYVVVDGRMRYQSSSRLLSTARKKQATLEAKNPRKKFRIVMLENG